MLVERAKDHNAGVQKTAIESLKSHIRSSTTSMTSVPKPLKFLRPFYAPLVEFYNTLHDTNENKVGGLAFIFTCILTRDTGTFGRRVICLGYDHGKGRGKGELEI